MHFARKPVEQQKRGDALGDDEERSPGVAAAGDISAAVGMMGLRAIGRAGRVAAGVDRGAEGSGPGLLRFSSSGASPA
ncbi:MAG TPA: hypothetical protein VHQ47_13975 [Phycisphaerae bacterium]|nr:hypothetical protein [Phycisphaerae bacterium]